MKTMMDGELKSLTANSCRLTPPTTPQYTLPKVQPILLSTKTSDFNARWIANAAGNPLFSTLLTKKNEKTSLNYNSLLHGTNNTQKLTYLEMLNLEVRM
jgi:hypothetical protein